MSPDSRRHLAEVAALTLATAHNWLSNRRIPPSLYVPANVAVATALVRIGRWGGASAEQLGLERSRLARGAATGLGAGVLAAGLIVGASAVPATRRWFADDRALDLSSAAVTYETLVRIPLGTALAEELTFRSALLGISLQRRSWPASVALSSALFGLWHVLPTMDTLPKHMVGRAAVESGQQHRAVGAAVLATGAGGVGLAALRWMTGSVAAPAVLHAVLNASALLAARRQGRVQGR